MPHILHTTSLSTNRLVTDGVDAAPGVDDQFLDVLCADEDLVRAEFDAIIAAEWPSPPPAEPDHGAGSARRPHRTPQRRKATGADRPIQPRDPTIDGWTRQRSPPPKRQPQPETGKAGDGHSVNLRHRGGCLLARTFHPLSA